MVLTEKLTAIADAVREKTGGDQPLTLDQIKTEIQTLSRTPERPYIDSSALQLAYFCYEGQNLEIFSHPSFDASMAEDVRWFFSGVQMSELPVQIAFPRAKKAYGMCLNMQARGILEYGCDLSHITVDLPSAEDATRLFEGSYFGVPPTVHLSTQCVNGERMFHNCAYMRSADIRCATGIQNFKYMFEYCYGLKSVSVDMRSATDYKNMFARCDCLETLSIGSLKIRSNEFRLDSCPKLSTESLVGVLQALESNVGEDTTYTVVLGSENLAKLTDAQKQIAIDKNLALA